MPIQHAVLGLLARGPSYGYELKASFEQAIGPQWGELNIGHLYQILDRLVRDGQVTRTVVSQRVRPDKNVYSMTEEGREALESWLEQPFVRQGGYRDDFFLKLFVAAELGPEALHRVARIQRESYLVELASLGRLRLAHHGEPLVSLLIEAAVLHTEANLRVVELADDRAERLAHASQHARSAEDGAGGPGPSEEARHGPPARRPEARRPEAREAGLAEVREAGLAEAREAGLAEAREAGLAEAREAGLAEAREAGLAEVREAGLAEVREAGLAEVREAGLAEVREAGLAEVREAGLAEAREARGTPVSEG